jgi:serine/threonine-protein kinase RIO1
MQEIMDEELAVQLQQQLLLQSGLDSLRASDAQWNDSEESVVVFAGESATTTCRALLSADSYLDGVIAAEDRVEAHDELFADDDGLYGDADDFSIASSCNGPPGGAGAAATSLRESMRRHAKEENHKRAPPNIDLGKYSGERDSLFDERTQLMLHKLITSDKLSSVESRVHSGREANVYHALGYGDDKAGRERSLALKIFKTGRGDYSKFNECDPSGRRYDIRFVKKSLRRQLKIWTDKEYKHLCQAQQSGASAPRPLLARDHILVMEFVGSGDGEAAPTMKSAVLTRSQLVDAYIQTLLSTRRLYQKARLVHGSLGDSSMLYHNDKVYFIDFGNAVERSHADHEETLDRDLEAVHALFQGRGLRRAKPDLSGLWSVATARHYVVSDSVDELLRGFPAMKAALSDEQ